MGRLVDDMLAMFGVKPSDRVVGPYSLWSSDSKTPSSELPHPAEAAMPEDCLSCRIIGTSAMGALGAYSAYIISNNYKMYTGRKKMAYLAAGASLSGSFFWMSICRAFDLGVFAKRKENTTLLDIFKEEIDSIVSLKRSNVTKSKDSSE
ncbi:hypothetical protein CAPTEDRAFT_188407 [Capitella teleta]|uniref:DUF4536 domain-containing protein n=1 Tax=Capitella teleta TaxID=283909 RepID=R7TRP1_CAPTE|nr:hypothetical protein CAPTEDRAFT_188407 [Capitella teleta]|eukprot:ELT96588.1 hypothetical protein CAPTEDRAFT_188407 [Capitella teleta]